MARLPDETEDEYWDRIESREPYRQFMYHLSKWDSIDARKITPSELNWCKMIVYSYPKNNPDRKTIIKMLEEWFPEEFI